MVTESLPYLKALLKLPKTSTTVKELQAALAALKDAAAVADYEGADIMKMPAISCLKTTGKRVIVL